MSVAASQLQAAAPRWRSLAQRDRRAELMDDPAIPPATLRRALRGIERLNRWSGSDRLLWRPLLERLREDPASPLRVLDLGTGSGDLPLALWQRARQAGLNLAVDGCDISPTAIDAARRRAGQAGAPLRFLQCDALSHDIPQGYDVVMCSLFLHHLDDAAAENLLRRMAAASRMVLVNDLVRCRAGLILAYAATALLTASPVVRTDGPRSVRAAFTLDEARAMAVRAGLAGANVRPAWPFRFLLNWRRE